MIRVESAQIVLENNTSVEGTFATSGVVTMSDTGAGDNAGLIIKNTNILNLLLYSHTGYNID